MQPSRPHHGEKTARAARKEHAEKLFIAELQFRLASAVRLATTLSDSATREHLRAFVEAFVRFVASQKLSPATVR